MFKGNDEIFERHMKVIKDMFIKSKNMQRNREHFNKQIAIMQQEFRDV
jgi:hypothetical protein